MSGTDERTASEEAVETARKVFEAMRDRFRNQQKDPSISQKVREETERAIAEARKNLTEERTRMRARIARELPAAVTGLLKTGSGFSIGEGYVVTTADVLEGMQTPVVVTDDGTRIKAEVVGLDSELNVGLLKLPSEAKLPYVRWGDSSKVQVGHFTISIGNQSGRNNSAALNLVSGLRTDGTVAGNHFYPGLIQVAGTVGAGTSGAPLINVRGEVVGVLAAVPTADLSWDRTERSAGSNLPDGARIELRHRATAAPVVRPARRRTREVDPEEGSTEPDHAPQPAQPAIPIPPSLMIFRPTVASAGYAIPINEVRQAVEEIRSGGTKARGWIGIVPRDEPYPVKVGDITYIRRRVVVDDVVQDSPACRAGIQGGDVLISIEGRPVENATQIRSISSRLQPGSHLPVVIKRGNATETLVLNIDVRPQVVKKKNKSSHP